MTVDGVDCYSTETGSSIRGKDMATFPICDSNKMQRRGYFVVAGLENPNDAEEHDKKRGESFSILDNSGQGLDKLIASHAKFSMLCAAEQGVYDVAARGGDKPQRSPEYGPVYFIKPNIKYIFYFCL
jgi:hypothetical protein